MTLITIIVVVAYPSMEWPARAMSAARREDSDSVGWIIDGLLQPTLEHRDMNEKSRLIIGADAVDAEAHSAKQLDGAVHICH